jgi:4-amino-4-deoxy-L-arabinose transferase-like glycosyltransferase
MAAGTSSLQVVRAAQIGLSLASVLLLYLLARQLFNPDIAAWAAVAWCFYPSFLYGGVLILTEVLFTFLLLAACVCATFVISARRRAWMWAVGAGASLGLAALTRSVVWPLPLILIPTVVLIAKVTFKEKLQIGAALCTGYLLCVAPWAVRNTRLQKTLVIIDAMGGMNLRMGNYEYTREDRMWDGVAQSGTRAWSYAMIVEHPDASHWTEGQRERWARDRAVAYMTAHPWTTVRRAALKFADFWGLEREYVAALRQAKYRPPLWFAAVSSAATVGAYVAAMVLACVGLFGRWHGDRPLHVVPLLILAGICGVHTIVFGHSRYHLPVMPILLMYAASAAHERWRLFAGRTVYVFPAAVVIGLLVLIWSRELLFRDPMRIRELLTAGL